MGTVLFDFLTESFLFNDADISDGYNRFSEKEVDVELQKYREFVLKSNIQSEISDECNSSSLNVFSSEKMVPVSQLKQNALYIEKHIMDDPLFSLTYTGNKISEVMSSYLGFDTTRIDKHQVSEAANYLKSLTPMVAHNYVKIYPLSYFYEPPQNLPINWPTNYYADLLPEDLMDWFHKNVVVESVESSGKYLTIKEKLELCRHIAISYKNYNISSAHFYQLFEQKILSFDEKTNEATFQMHLPDTLPTSEMFNAWVYQSINRSSKDVFDKIFHEVSIASAFNASYLTTSPFVSDLLNFEFPAKEDIKTHTAKSVMNLELPCIDDINTEKLMSIRANESDIFQNFRTELDRQFRELRTIKDQSELQVKTENIMHELTDSKIQDLNKTVKNLQQKGLADATLFTGGLISTIQTGGLSLIASAIAAAKGFKTVQEYNEKVKQNPAFFMWKVLKK